MDTTKTKLGEYDTGKRLGRGMTYGSRCCYLPEHNAIYSSGPGQLGYSKMISLVAAIFLQDRSVNAELEKFFPSRDKVLAINLTSESKEGSGFSQGSIA